jgi:hypothetical protein
VTNPERPATVVNGGPVAAVVNVGGRLIDSLPGQFLALCLLNVIFIGSLFWFEAHQTESRAELARAFLNACLMEMHKREAAQ